MSSSSSSRPQKRRRVSPKTNQLVTIQTHAPSAWVGIDKVPRLMMSDSATYTFVQDMGGNTITQQANAVTYGALSFRLSYLDQGASFAALFDRFKIKQVQITLRPTANSTLLSAPSSVYVPQLITAIDRDDVTVPASLATLRQYNNVCVTLHETQVRTWVPGTLIGGMIVQNAWIDMANYNTQDFFGIKYAVEAGLAGQTLLQSFAYTTRIVFECSHVR
jgi:hypothetical protein